MRPSRSEARRESSFSPETASDRGQHNGEGHDHAHPRRARARGGRGALIVVGFPHVDLKIPVRNGHGIGVALDLDRIQHHGACLVRAPRGQFRHRPIGSFDIAREPGGELLVYGALLRRADERLVVFGGRTISVQGLLARRPVTRRAVRGRTQNQRQFRAAYAHRAVTHRAQIDQGGNVHVVHSGCHLRDAAHSEERVRGEAEAQEADGPECIGEFSGDG
jgi:hypothetical protein